MNNRKLQWASVSAALEASQEREQKLTHHQTELKRKVATLWAHKREFEAFYLGAKSKCNPRKKITITTEQQCWQFKRIFHHLGIMYLQSVQSQPPTFSLSALWTARASWLLVYLPRATSWYQAHVLLQITHCRRWNYWNIVSNNILQA